MTEIREEGRKGGRGEGRKGGREEGRKGGREEGRSVMHGEKLFVAHDWGFAGSGGYFFRFGFRIFFRISDCLIGCGCGPR